MTLGSFPLTNAAALLLLLPACVWGAANDDGGSGPLRRAPPPWGPPIEGSGVVEASGRAAGWGSEVALLLVSVVLLRAWLSDSIRGAVEKRQRRRTAQRGACR